MQQVPVIFYLNLRIIQSEHGISIYQSEHIQILLAKYFKSTDNIPITNTPILADTQFDTEVSESIPANAQELD